MAKLDCRRWRFHRCRCRCRCRRADKKLVVVDLVVFDVGVAVAVNILALEKSRGDYRFKVFCLICFVGNHVWQTAKVPKKLGTRRTTLREKTLESVQKRTQNNDRIDILNFNGAV